MTSIKILPAIAWGTALWVGVAGSAQSDISVGIPSVSFNFGGTAFSVERNAQPKDVGRFMPEDMACPPRCIEPGSAASGVQTLTELEVLAYMQSKITDGSGILVDARLPEAFAEGSLPGAISVPAATLVADNPYREDLLLALGARGSLGQMQFDGAFDLLVFDDGAFSPVARTAVSRLLDAGYPAQKIFYYRGGLHMWHALGLSVTR